MKPLYIILGIIVLIVLAGVIIAIVRRRKMISDLEAIQFMANLNRKPGANRYHLLNNFSNEELEWLKKFYDDEIGTKYHKVAGGMLVERPSEFQLQIESALDSRMLSDAQIDEINDKIWKKMQWMQRSAPQYYQQLDDMRKKLNQLKSEFTIEL